MHHNTCSNDCPSAATNLAIKSITPLTRSSAGITIGTLGSVSRILGGSVVVYGPAMGAASHLLGLEVGVGEVIGGGAVGAEA